MTSIAKSALSALRQDKPHSSITDLVDILTGAGYAEDNFEGIPDLKDSIDIQYTGPAEASRAIRKKLKHGTSHQQYRALFILNALVTNGDTKMKTSLFVDGQLTDVLRNMTTDYTLDAKVRNKLKSILSSWYRMYKNDLSMKTAANLYKQYTNDANSVWRSDSQAHKEEELEAARRKNKEEARRKEKEEAERLQREREEKKRKKRDDSAAKLKPKRKPFNFEEEKPKILTQIASATQSANNLVNAITLMNREDGTLQENVRVQECLEVLKRERKPIVRYIQLVENEDMIGTLIETNDRLVAALDMYDKATSKPTETQDEVENVRKGLASTKIEDSQPTKQREKQRARVHPDLQDLNFGELGEDKNVLPPPLEPNARQTSSDENVVGGSLSDFSDYESSDEETHKRNARKATSSSNNYSGGRSYPGATRVTASPVEDPFADPFGDSHGVR